MPPTPTPIPRAGDDLTTYSEVMPREATRAVCTRRLVFIALNRWGLAQLADSATLIMSELFANAVAHTQSADVMIQVERVGPQRVRVTVTDTSRTPPTPRQVTDKDDHGRGLAIIRAFSDRWGTEVKPWGKRVWAELCTPEKEDAS